LQLTVARIVTLVKGRPRVSISKFETRVESHLESARLVSDPIESKSRIAQIMCTSCNTPPFFFKSERVVFKQKVSMSGELISESEDSAPMTSGLRPPATCIFSVVRTLEGFGVDRWIRWRIACLGDVTLACYSNVPAIFRRGGSERQVSAFPRALYGLQIDMPGPIPSRIPVPMGIGGAAYR